MSRKSYQKVILSVELTLPAGVSAARAVGYVKQALMNEKGGMDIHDPVTSLDHNLAVIKILRRETIYTN